MTTEYVRLSIFTVKSVINITNAIVWQSIIEEMHIVACFGEGQHSNKSNTKERHLLYFSGMAQQYGFSKEITVGHYLTKKMHFCVTCPMFNRAVWVQRNDHVET